MGLFYQRHGKKIWFIVVLLLSLYAGRWLSLQKPLWNDEIYTQERAIDALSYQDILAVKFVEGNNSPLFYIIQKAVCDLWGFQLPMEWKGEWYLSHPRAQFVMRLAPNLFMSLSIALIFYYFASRYSYGVGLYALMVTLSTHMIWAYWAEARPYALWIFLTTAQSLLFLQLIRHDRPSRCSWGLLCLVHILLSLSVILSLGQILVVSGVLFYYKDKKPPIKFRQPARFLIKYFFLTVLPAGICLFYYFVMPSSLFRYCVLQPVQLILANVPVDRLCIFLLYIGFLGYCYHQKGAQYKALFTKTLYPHENRTLCTMGVSYSMVIALMLAFAGTILLFCKTREIPSQQTISLSDRYFMFLVPMQIIATTVFSCSMFRFFRKKKWILFNLVIALGGLLVLRFLRTAVSVLAFYQ
jgi:hypothetical protein